MSAADSFPDAINNAVVSIDVGRGRQGKANGKQTSPTEAAKNSRHSSRKKDHIDLFFESVTSSVKAFPPEFIAETKLRVSQLIYEIELRYLKQKEKETNASISSATQQVQLLPHGSSSAPANNIITITDTPQNISTVDNVQL